MSKLKIYCRLFFLFTGIVLKAQKSFELNVRSRGQPILLFPGFTYTNEVFDAITRSLVKDHKPILAEKAGHFIMHDRPQGLLKQINIALTGNE